jgi:hypothetical protein
MTRRLRNWLNFIGAASVVLAIYPLNSNAADLDLKIRLGEPQRGEQDWLYITNTGEGPITIKGIVVNNRKDCPILTRPRAGNIDTVFVPPTLQVGDESQFYSPECNMVRIEVDTDQGSKAFGLR